MAEVRGGGIREHGRAQHGVQHLSFESCVSPGADLLTGGGGAVR